MTYSLWQWIRLWFQAKQEQADLLYACDKYWLIKLRSEETVEVKHEGKP